MKPSEKWSDQILSDMAEMAGISVAALKRKLDVDGLWFGQILREARKKPEKAIPKGRPQAHAAASAPSVTRKPRPGCCGHGKA